MKQTKLFYPSGIEHIWHKSADGKTVYQLDSIQKVVQLKKAFENDGEFKVIDVTDGDTALWSLIHTPKYIEALISGQPRSLAESSGIMWQESFPQAYVNSAKAMILASETALAEKFSITLGKGGHHTLSDHGYGFGPVNEVAIAIKYLHNHNPKLKIAVLDTDVHIGNGWKHLLRNKENVLLVDLWSKTIPKWDLPQPALNVHSVKINTVSEYIPQLKSQLKDVESFKPDLLIYHCGLDVLQSDRMGGIKGFDASLLKEREQLITDFVKENDLSLVFVSGGGYIDHSNPIKAQEDLQQITRQYKEIILLLNR